MFVHYELKYDRISRKSCHPKVLHALHLNRAWFLKYMYLQKFTPGPDFLPLLSDNECYLSPIYLWWNWHWFVILSTEKQSISVSFAFIQCQLGDGWGISTRPKNRHFGNSSLENIQTAINIPRAFICALFVLFLLWFLTVTCSCCPYLYFGSAIMLVTYFVNFR